MEPSVRIENVSHRYSVQWAIRDINIVIPEKGIYGLLGSNGAGKSTLMNILCGTMRQTDGNIWIRGINTKESPIATKRLIGFLPQKPPLYMDFTVEEYLNYCAGVRLMEKKDIAQAVENVMQECGIAHFRRRLLRNLSGGYQQRVGIAQAIIHKPDLVVLDEPTNGLDPNQILEIRDLIKKIAEERTVVLSTHMLSEVQAICDYIMMIEQGQLVFSGTVNDFNNYITPNSVFVELLDAPEMETLAKVPGVDRLVELGDNSYRIYSSDVCDLVDNMVDFSSKNRWRLREIRIEKSSLNAVFAELSKKVK